jgi:hypothetical protein
MKPYTITEDTSNKDLYVGMDRRDGRDYYLDLWGDYKSRFGSPVIERYKDRYILRADLAPGGLKAFGAERVISESKYDTMVYCAPRQGHAPDAIAAISKVYNKKCVFFMPSSKQVSDHQGALFAYNNIEAKFFRIAAMPVLNSYAAKWAKNNNAQYLTFGLTGIPMVTAGLVNMCRNISNELKQDPSEIYCAVSTGTMVRALQIGWPNAKPRGIAVARNIHKGEIGEADVSTATMPFLTRTPVADTMPIPTTGAYDAKAWELFDKEGAPGSIFINVGSDDQINRNLDQVNVASINSFREWKDMEDLSSNRSIKEGFTNHAK